MGRGYFVAVIVGFIIASPGRAIAEVDVVVTVNGDVAVPIGEFGDHTALAAPGFRIGGGVGIPVLPITLGAEAGMLWFGTDSITERDRALLGYTYTTYIRSLAFFVHFVARAQVRHGPIRPFFDAILGLKIFSGVAELEMESNLTGRITVTEEENFSRHASLSYGFGIGVDFVIIREKRSEGPPSRHGDVYFTIGGRFLSGGESEYVMAGSVRHSPAGPVVSTFRSRTPMLVPHIGLTGHYD